MKNKVKKLLKNKSVLYIGYVLLLTVFVVALNITFSAFTNSRSEAAANISVAGMSYAMKINNVSTTSAMGTASNETFLDISLTAQNANDSKYELTYQVCTTSACTAFMPAPAGFSVEYSSATTDAITGSVSGAGTKQMRVVLINETGTSVYVKFGINAGYLHNTLTLLGDISEEYNESDDIQVAVYVDNIKQSVFPAKTSGKNFHGGTCTNGATVSFDPRTWSVKVNATEPTQCNVHFGTQTYCAKNNITNLKDCLLATEGGEDIMDVKPSPDFTQSATTEASTGMFMAYDEYGKSYYYRGHRSYLNNNVMYAGYAWKVIRVNGDGSIRLIYNGTSATNTTGTGTTIGNDNYSANTRCNSDIGFFTGTRCASSYVLEHSNATNGYLWYNWLRDFYRSKSAALNSRIAHNLFCNDRSKLPSNSGFGGGTSPYANTTYAGAVRLPKSPTLKCINPNDQFTGSAASNGNKKLGSQPMALITADEVVMAGAGSTSNTNYYLYNGLVNWTMTPHSVGFNPTSTQDWTYVYQFSATLGEGDVGGGGAIRPVINIRADVIFSSGNGSASSPYVVVTT